MQISTPPQKPNRENIAPNHGHIVLKHSPKYIITQTESINEASLPDDIQFLHLYGIDLTLLQTASLTSKKAGTSAAECLLAAGVLTEAAYFECLAHHLRLPFDDKHILQCSCLGEFWNKKNLVDGLRLVLVRGNSQKLMVYISPDGLALRKLKFFLDKHPSLKSRIVVTTRSAIRQVFIAGHKKSLTRIAITSLKTKYPELSASTTFTKAQIVIAMVLAKIAIVGLLFAAGIFLVLLHILASVFYLLCVLVRIIAAFSRKIDPETPVNLKHAINSPHTPLYSILVALYREEDQVADLVSALSKMKWPKTRLEIKLICEEDDQATIDAVRRCIPGPPFELVIVPPSLPRTKPKALNFALKICKGQYIVLYDAEDRPHPLQLREAFSRFSRGGARLACLQAPLLIHNHRYGWLPSLFAIEYSALFSGLLPALADWKTPIPLGGTSNHFRRPALEKSGAWDPYNVTEDADLGIRLARMGYRTDVLRLPTYEEAPIHIGVWIRQRTRWFKGWLQTWLVHMRNPGKLHRDLGLFNSLMFHAMITGMIISALMHPLFIVSLGFAIYHLLSSSSPALFYQILALVDIINIVLGYAAFMVLSWRALPVSGLTRLRRKLIAVPLYWLLISWASWRAVWHLCTRPFEWEKTPHIMRKPKTDGGISDG